MHVLSLSLSVVSTSAQQKQHQPKAFSFLLLSLSLLGSLRKSTSDPAVVSRSQLRKWRKEREKVGMHVCVCVCVCVCVGVCVGGWVGVIARLHTPAEEKNGAEMSSHDL